MDKTEYPKINIKDLVEDILQISLFYDYFNQEKEIPVYFAGIYNFKHVFKPVNDKPIRFYSDKDVIHEYDMSQKSIYIDSTEVNKYVHGFYQCPVED